MKDHAHETLARKGEVVMNHDRNGKFRYEQLLMGKREIGVEEGISEWHWKHWKVEERKQRPAHGSGYCLFVSSVGEGE